jgi:phosphate transport system substrate-binding protein
MKALLMKGLEFPKAQRRLIQHSMSGPYLALTKDEQGLAYSVYYYEHFMSGSPNTKTIAVDGVAPTYETIRSREYPYTTEVYIVTHAGLKKRSPIAKFRGWLLSEEGQAVVRESGYVPLHGESSAR